MDRTVTYHYDLPGNQQGSVGFRLIAALLKVGAQAVALGAQCRCAHFRLLDDPERGELLDGVEQEQFRISITQRSNQFADGALTMREFCADSRQNLF